MMSTNFALTKAVAGVQLLGLSKVHGALADFLNRVRLGAGRTVIFDINGEKLVWRVPLLVGDAPVGYLDLAIAPELGAPLVAVSYSPNCPWIECDIVLTARTAAREDGWDVRESDEVRFVFFNYPKVGVQFRREGREIVMIEWISWMPVRRFRRSKEGEIVHTFRCSVLDNMAPEIRYSNEVKHHVISSDLRMWGDYDIDSLFPLTGANGTLPSLAVVLAKIDVISYSEKVPRHRCFELRGQQTRSWCVPACLEMVLDFYRYEYSQRDIAKQIGLGTISYPMDLGCSAEFRVVDNLELMTNNSLVAAMNACSFQFWPEFRREIDSNRPLIVFSGDHSRVLVGYLYVLLGGRAMPLRGLMFYDPWPVNEGAIVFWESFDPLIYTTSFSSRLRRFSFNSK